MDIQSLKRVLTELKGEARKMRKEQLGARLSPGKGKEEETPAEPGAEAAAEEKPEEEVEVSLEEPATEEGDAAGEEPEEEAKPAEGEDADLKRVLAKFGI